ncbi:hypothetical protein [Bryobacter aggregatus]|uniref:hypothetical protein n=1 Tax=Bryobacter aggregatus TaxID=360054 RepID=UPI0012BAF465|nr:hypothetical protein [Bryobacter aggregatus]
MIEATFNISIKGIPCVLQFFIILSLVKEPRHLFQKILPNSGKTVVLFDELLRLWSIRICTPSELISKTGGGEATASGRFYQEVHRVG